MKEGPIDNMSKFILGTKGQMLTVFTEDGRALAATVITAAPNVIAQIKTKEKDGYNAVQFGAIEAKESRIGKAQVGHAQGKALKHFRELRERDGSLTPALEVGATVNVSAFIVGDMVAVSAISKGKGFQGVVKRHGFRGGQRTHGQKHSEREPGSIGGGPGRAGGRVAPGMRMAGRMGGDRVTVRNLAVVQIHPETNEILIAGSIPGNRGGLVEVRAVSNESR